MDALIEYRDVRVDGDDGPIVAGFSAAVPAGRLTVMVGPSGAGKTTLLRLLNRLDDPDAGAREDLAVNRREVEARLALGQPSRQAALPWQRLALRTGMLPTVDQTKVVGLVALPGAMTGMILAGASPLAAIRLQLLVMYMLLGGNAFAALVSGELTLRRLFTADHQLIRMLRRRPQ